ncbi:MAG: hypothetical protein WAU02_04085 [Candidatus Saccharimonadales bacterium]
MRIAISENASDSAEEKVPSRAKKVVATAKITTRHSRRKRLRVFMTKLLRVFGRRRWIVLLAVGLLAAVSFMTWSRQMPLPHQAIKYDGYQVVYLTNGQAYFGKLQNVDGEYLVMKQPYTAQPVEAAKDKPEQPITTALLRVRDQVYGPEDSIAIRAGTVAFWQNLRDDSKIVTALKAKQ